MAARRKVEVFTAGCPLCQETVKLVKEPACPRCEVIVYDRKILTFHYAGRCIIPCETERR